LSFSPLISSLILSPVNLFPFTVLKNPISDIPNCSLALSLMCNIVHQIKLWLLVGRTIAQVVSRWLPTAAARIRARIWLVGLVVDKVALEQIFSEYFGFPCQSSFHQTLHHHNQPGQVQ
jgi:hypothetical protein